MVLNEPAKADEAEKLPASVGPPSGGQVASLTPLSPMYSTEPRCLV